MQLLTHPTPLGLWQSVIKGAENRCSISLDQELETYLVSLLIRYANKPEVVKQVFATAFLDALQRAHIQRNVSLQNVGDQCLLFAGLFPRAAERRHVRVSYFVDLGRSAYNAVSSTTSDLFSSLALQFVVLMDVLQSINEHPNLMPIDAYEQWEELGSQRALKILQAYAKGIPLKNNHR